MSTTDTVRETLIETEAPEVEVAVEVKIPKKKRGKKAKAKKSLKRRNKRFMRWLKKILKAIRKRSRKASDAAKRAGNRARKATKTAALTAVNWTKQGASTLGRGARRVGHGLYWSGATVGRGLGRTARFFGRSALTLVRAIPRFLARTTGWMVRSISWVFRTVLETVFAVSLAAWLVIALVTAAAAVTHDKYENNVHRHAKAWSVGEYRKSKSSFGAPVKAQKLAGFAANEMANRAGPWEAEPSDIVVKEKVTTKRPARDDDPPHEKVEKTAWRWQDIEDMVDFWLNNQRKDWGVPFDATDKALGSLTAQLTLMNSGDDLGVTKTVLEDPRGMKLTDNQYFRGKSYWTGRYHGFLVAQEAVTGVEPSDGWENNLAEIRQKVGAAWVFLNNSEKEAYEARELHPNSFRQGYNHMVEWMLEREKTTIYDTMEPQVEVVVTAKTTGKKAVSV